MTGRGPGRRTGSERGGGTTNACRLRGRCRPGTHRSRPQARAVAEGRGRVRGRRDLRPPRVRYHERVHDEAGLGSSRPSKPSSSKPRKSVSPQDLGNLVRHVTDAIDGDGGADTDADQRERTGCYLSRTTDGMLDIRGLCDPLTGDIIETAVNAQMARDLQANDPRTTPQRRMDAITTLLRLPLERGDVGESHGIRPHVSLVADIGDLPGTTPDLVAIIRGQRRDHGHISETMLEMLLCDCTFSRILMHGESEVLDVGRAARTVSAAQWRALVARDRHCTAPGCTRPPSQCVAHHDEHWSRGGPTDLANLRLLCWFDHPQQHIADAQARRPWRVADNRYADQVGSRP